MPVEQPRRKRDNDGALNRRLNIPQKSHHQANTLFRDAFGGAKVGKDIMWKASWIAKIRYKYLSGQLGGINVIGLTLPLHQGVASIATQAIRPALINQVSAGENSSLQMQLHPRQPSIRNMEMLALNPELLFGNL